MREGYQPDLEAMLQRNEIDVAITILEKKPPAGLRSATLLKLPLVLLAPAGSTIRNAEELWRKDKITEPLICLPPAEAICRNFQNGLNRRGVDWFPSIEISSVDIVTTYVENGFGIGLTVSIPKTKMSSKVREIPLPGFDPVVIGVLWQGRGSTALRALLDEFAASARQLVA